jgi:hypothetical protein
LLEVVLGGFLFSAERVLVDGQQGTKTKKGREDLGKSIYPGVIGEQILCVARAEHAWIPK